MKQPETFGGEISGASIDRIVNCCDLAKEAWGEQCDEDNSALTAMAYLWRRFGPPIWGSDDYKDLCAYYLTTDDPRVFLWLHLDGTGLAISSGYVTLVEVQDEILKPEVEWYKAYDEWWWKQHPEFEEWEDTKANQKIIDKLFWAEQDEMRKKAQEEIGTLPRTRHPEHWRDYKDGLEKHINQVLFDAMKELLRPVYIRDCPINILGRCNDSEEPAEPSKYAGLGVPIKEMKKMLKENKR